MSKGNPRVTVRLEPRLLESVASAVDKRNAGCVTIRHWTLSDYIVQAIRDKLAHDRRSAKRRANKAAPPPLDTFDSPTLK